MVRNLRKVLSTLSYDDFTHCGKIAAPLEETHARGLDRRPHPVMAD